MTPRRDNELTRGKLALITGLFLIGILCLATALWLLRDWASDPQLRDMRPPETRSGLDGAEISDITGAARGRRDQSRIVRLYFTRDGQTLTAEEILVPEDNASNAEALSDIMEKLLAGPLGEGLQTSIPDGTKLRAVYIRGRTATIDLSENARLALGGTHAEWLSVQSIALTITESLPSIESVRILIEGEPVDVLWRTIDITAPIYADRSLTGG
jgi:spore germination protein GerM